MTGASKILTVSYGTFSCTLEGFDEPFNTMKAIAEYFRDLAAEDRYFGAEPPTPDAAMLHQIAEREMKRRVEAKVSGNGVILRATDSQAVDAPAPRILTAPNVTVNSPVSRPNANAPFAEDAPRSAEQMFEDQHAAGPMPTALVDTPADRDVTQDLPAQDLTAHILHDSVAEKLARIRSAMANSRAAGDTTRAPASVAAAAAIADAEVLANAEAAEKEAAELHAKVEAETTAARAQEAAEAADAADKAAEAARVKAAEEARVKAAEEARVKAAEEEAEEAAQEAQAKAAKEAADAAAAAEAHAKAAAEAAEKAAQDDALLASLAGSFDDETPPSDGRFDDEEDATIAPLNDSAADGDDSLMASLANAMAASAEPTPTPKADVGEALADNFEDDLEDDDLSPIAAKADVEIEVAPTDTAKDADVVTDTDTDTDTDTVTDAPPETVLSEAAPSDTEASETGAPETAPAANPTLQRARARVIKIRRAPVDGATPANTTSSSLSAEAEADLMRELEGLQDTPAPAASASPSAKDGDDNTVQVRPQRPVSPRRLANDMAGAEDDASVKRLLDQTNTELQGPENRRRLSAISHLKAAVAATFADREAGGDSGPTEEMRMNPYRSDLERVVRPRPAAEVSPPAPTAPERISPLMLVSEQRIDTPRVKPTHAPNHITPVRPRRVVPSGLVADVALTDDDDGLDAAIGGADQRNIFGATTSFAEYAERLGAESLADLLEAAVAYSANVEGQADVSRPQMLEHVLTVQPELENDREQMLASFGTLLREGRIEKVRRGFFVLSESSPIQGEARKAAKG